MKFALLVACSLLAFLQVLSAVKLLGRYQTPVLDTERIKREVSPRIIGGTPATQGQLPYQAAIWFEIPSNPGKFALCGGILISSNAVLTAAHCLDLGAVVYQVVLGTLRAGQSNSTGYYARNTTNVKKHESYNANNGYDNDIGILILPENAPSNSNIQPILLPKQADANAVLNGLDAIVSGWGTVSDSSYVMNTDLLWAEAQIIQNLYCEKAYGAAIITDRKLCVNTHNGTSGACNGDSGGPLALSYNGENVAVGLVSFGPNSGCQSGMPVVFTRTSKYLTWIANNGGPAVRP